MYYSILPIDETDHDVEYQEIIYQGQLVLTKTVDKIQTIERIYSTNPQVFLNPSLQPGTILENPLINSQKRCYNEY